MARARAGDDAGSLLSLVFVELPSAALIRLDRDDGRPVEGAFVKLTPRLRRSERAAFDVAAARRSLLERGAVAVTVAPVLLPDEVERAPQHGARVDARAEVVAWFGSDAGEDAEQAREGCLAILDQVGL